MNAEQLIIEQDKIDAEAKSIGEKLNLGICCDGVISPEHYSLTPIKTAWVFREPYDRGGACDYDYKKAIVQRLQITDTKRNKYFDPMRYIEYSLKTKFALYGDIPDADTNIEVSKLLLQTAFINIKKSMGKSQIDGNTFWNDVAIFSDLVKRQIAAANPKIIIASGTIDFFRGYGYLKNASQHEKNYRYYYHGEGKIILDCYHLGQRQISPEDLCDDIIMALKNAKENGFLE